MRISGPRASFAAIAVGATALLVLTGCTSRDGGGESPTAAPVDQSAVVASMPAGTKDVDAVTWALVEGEPLSLLAGSDYNFVAPNICESLLRVEPDFSIGDGIASSADWTDPVTFVIDIREGVTFSDGTPVTPDDVIYSLGRHKDNVADGYFGAFVFVDSMEATGDSQVTVHFSAPDADFRAAIASGGGAVLSKAFSEKAGAALGTSSGGILCAGPYELDSWTPGSEIVTVANKNYYGGAPHVAKITYKFIADGTTLTNALLEGEVDGAFNVPPAARTAFEGSDKGHLVLGPSTASYSFGPTRSTGAGANPEIRRALSMAIDREQYIQTVLGGLGYVQNSFVAPFSWSGSPAADTYQAAYDELPALALDLDAAKKLVAESGEDTSVPLKIAVPAGAKELSQTAAIVQSAAQQIGLTVEVDERQASDFAAIFVDESAREDIDFVATVGYIETPGALPNPQLFALPADLGGIFNWSGYANDEVTALLQQARTATDPQASADAYVKAQAIFAPDMLQVTLAGAYQTLFISNDLTGAVTSVAAYSSPWALQLGGK